MNKYMVVFRRGEVSHSIAPLEAKDIAHAINRAIQMMSEVYSEQIEKTLGNGFKWTMQDICIAKLMEDKE